ncbi:Hypothetical protein FKW44_002500 [Caligus rogercresseyi]|uniref:Uncharacterized protein n=1 Tax=Caligus rogercresseyi TaxID=217165 RepID=A0A7T8KKA1_CALRO|nr:Hypothetical protein FKW44_002500 [Caligus rogercresseyi]
MIIRQVATELSLPQKTVSRLLTEELGLQLKCTRPHQHYENNNRKRVKCCQKPEAVPDTGRTIWGLI